MEDNKFQTRYPNYNVLDKWSSPDWDDQTREVVRQRLEEVPPIRFFTSEEAHTLAAVAERTFRSSRQLPSPQGTTMRARRGRGNAQRQVSKDLCLAPSNLGHSGRVWPLKK
jgi:hypothetical protein